MVYVISLFSFIYRANNKLKGAMYISLHYLRGDGGMKRSPWGMLLLLMVNALMSTCSLQSDEVLDIIYIRMDGSIDPPEAPILNVGNFTYVFTGNIHYPIVVERDNIVINGAGYVVEGTENQLAKGIDLSGRRNVTVRNVKIRKFEYGIWLEDSLNIHIYSNDVSNNRYGIVLWDSSNIRMYENNVVANRLYGVILHWSSNNTLRHNNIAENRYNFGVWGAELSDFINDIDASNTVDGKPVYYWINKQDRNVPIDAGYLALINCTRITIQNLNLAKNGQGILLVFTTNSTITGNIIKDNDYGIWIHNSSKNSIHHNVFVDNTEQVRSKNSTNAWDAGYPSGGNYWSDYSGVDLCHGSGQNVFGGDGLGDTPYFIDVNNQDRYPLVEISASPYWWLIFLTVAVVIGLEATIILVIRKRKSKSL